ncbi:MAG TPA: YtxH domain-containing protein [Glaciihabitans sp.]|jgi:hypothetical protein|nr:YtxH domain-containing protein [Glaciihabitans sp.]
MQGKIMFVLGAAAGYVIGTRKGRQGYEKLKQQASDFWQNPQVQRTVNNAEDFAREKIPVVGEKVSAAAKKATHSVDEAVKNRVKSDDSNESTSTPSDSSGSTSTPTGATPSVSSDDDGARNG